MKIGALSEQTQTPVETIRFYEQAGLLPSAPRTSGNFRIYDRACVERLRFIRRCRNLDMTLEEIRVLLAYRDSPTRNCQEVHVLLDEHIGHVSARLRELLELDRQLRSLRGLCAEVRDNGPCGLLQGLDTLVEFTARPVHSHTHGAHPESCARSRKTCA